MPAIGNALGLPFARFRSSALAPPALAPPVAGPDIWLDANQELFANNDPVGQFTDWSGNGNHFTSSGTARPTFKTNRINGRPTVSADGVDDGMILASVAAYTEWSLYVVGRLITDVAPRNFLSVDDYNPDYNYILFQYHGSGIAVTWATTGAVFSATMAVGSAMAYCLTGTASLGTIRASDNTGGSSSANFSKASAPMRLFRRGDGLYINGEIAEFLFYGTKHDTTDRTAVWTYFNTRYGTAIPATP